MEDGVKSKDILWSMVGPSGSNFPDVSISLDTFMDGLPVTTLPLFLVGS